MSRKRRERRDSIHRASRQAEPRKIPPSQAGYVFHACLKCGAPMNRTLADEAVAAAIRQGREPERIEICGRCSSWHTIDEAGKLRLMTPAECFCVRMRAPEGAASADGFASVGQEAIIFQDAEPPPDGKR